MKVVLAIMAKGSPSLLRRAIDSASHLVDEVLLVVAPKDPLTSFELPIPGRIVEVPWMGPARTRSAMYAHAERQNADWILMLDADDQLEEGATLPLLTYSGADAYEIVIEQSNPSSGERVRWYSPLLVRARSGFSWQGAGDTGIYEKLKMPHGTCSLEWKGMLYLATKRSDRSYAEDLNALHEPRSARGHFFRALTLQSLGRDEEAFHAFVKRVRMNSDRGEVYWSLLQAAKLAAKLFGDREVHQRFLACIAYEPTRAEGYYHYARVLQPRNSKSAETYMRIAQEKPYPDTKSFVELSCYSHESLQAAGIRT